ncbi:MAG: tRNA (adenosine(37)-N6)-dimethylallyltransferase MiaA [Pseudomonadota bacterium]|nr:tRNA (adenosine(37)-N6)-dimethylallyltransferase MiaA [Pseudomonadota bacterium]
MKQNSSEIILVGGPTASGKSALALDLARRENGVIINADSMQVYAGLPILTACPSAKDMKATSHRLYGVLDPSEKCSAERWRQMAVTEIEQTLAQGKKPVLVGGTGLYFKALTEGLAPVPAVPAEVQKRAVDQRRTMGPEAFHADLQRRDPVLGARLYPGDTQRVTRAWAVHEATGRPLSEWQAERHSIPPPEWRFRWIVLDPPREVLYDACNRRFEKMVEQGAVEEVRAFLQRGLDPSLPAMKAVGVRELAAFIAGEISLEEAIHRAQQATRNYAKRQVTWFKNQVAGGEVRRP